MRILAPDSAKATLMQTYTESVSLLRIIAPDSAKATLVQRCIEYRFVMRILPPDSAKATLVQGYKLQRLNQQARKTVAP